MKEIKCKGCGKQNTFSMMESGEYFWVRCEKCGLHTSSYLFRPDAVRAAELGEHYISENGNKVFESIHDNKELFRGK